jgi:aspartyl-tRNA synthetase
MRCLNPQQTFKQILMVAGMDKYFQIVKCFRDEDLRADRQPEFTQIDCEMSFVHREDILNMFEGLTSHLFKEMLGLDLGVFPRMSYDDAMKYYGIDKPDLRFGMPITELNEQAKGKGFNVFDSVPYIGAIVLEGKAESYSNKEIKELTEMGTTSTNRCQRIGAGKI